MRRFTLLLAIAVASGCSESAPQKLPSLSSGPKMDVSEGGGDKGASKGKVTQPVPPSDGFKP